MLHNRMHTKRCVSPFFCIAHFREEGCLLRQKSFDPHGNSQTLPVHHCLRHLCPPSPPIRPRARPLVPLQLTTLHSQSPSGASAPHNVGHPSPSLSVVADLGIVYGPVPAGSYLRSASSHSPTQTPPPPPPPRCLPPPAPPCKAPQRWPPLPLPNRWSGPSR